MKAHNESTESSPIFLPAAGNLENGASVCVIRPLIEGYFIKKIHCLACVRACVRRLVRRPVRRLVRAQVIVYWFKEKKREDNIYRARDAWVFWSLIGRNTDWRFVRMTFSLLYGFSDFSVLFIVGSKVYRNNEKPEEKAIRGAEFFSTNYHELTWILRCFWGDSKGYIQLPEY